MNNDDEAPSHLSTVHIRVPKALKLAWVRESRRAGMRLGDWLVLKIQEAQGDHNDDRCDEPSK
jgi:hypothetical protein